MFLTDFPIRQVIRHPLARRSVTVSVVRDLSATLRRITLVGADLDGFTAPGPDDHIKVFFPDDHGPVARDFTPRDFRPGAAGGAELDLDIVLHGTDAPASGWASRAVTGDRIEIGGPRGSRLAPVGIRSACLIADATALPALARWLLHLPQDLHVDVVVIGDAAMLDGYLAEADRPGVAVQFVGAHSPSAALIGAALIAAVGELAIEEHTFVWAAGEATALIPLRRHLRTQLKLSRDQAQFSGYWKAGVDNLDHHAPLDATDPD